jgi:hypothetical protein
MIKQFTIKKCVYWLIVFCLSTVPSYAQKSKKDDKKQATTVPAKMDTAKAKPAKSRITVAARTTRPKAIAAPVEKVLELSDVQLVLASMVQTGRADCEFQQSVVVEPNLQQLGGFVVKFQNAAYRMIPEQTTTGAIRLVDPKAGVSWLQIRYKSMLMNMRAGQRMVDACSLPAQRLAEAEAERLLKAAAEAPAEGLPTTDTVLKELPLLRN